MRSMTIFKIDSRSVRAAATRVDWLIARQRVTLSGLGRPTRSCCPPKKEQSGAIQKLVINLKPLAKKRRKATEAIFERTSMKVARRATAPLYTGEVQSRIPLSR